MVDREASHSTEVGTQKKVKEFELPLSENLVLGY